MIIIADGELSYDPEIVNIDAAKKLDRLGTPTWQISLQFFQVGKEAGATKYLQSLDDNLAEIAGQPIRDMVDTQAWTNKNNQEFNADGILKWFLD